MENRALQALFMKWAINPKDALNDLHSMIEGLQPQELTGSYLTELLRISSIILFRQSSTEADYDTFLKIASLVNQHGDQSDRALAYVYLVDRLFTMIGLDVNEKSSKSLLSAARSCIATISTQQDRERAKINLAYLYWNIGQLSDMEILCQENLSETQDGNHYTRTYHLLYASQLDRYYRPPLTINQEALLIHNTRAYELIAESSDWIRFYGTLAVYYARAGDFVASQLELQRMMAKTSSMNNFTFWAYLLCCIACMEHGNFKLARKYFLCVHRNQHLMTRLVDRQLYRQIRVRVLWSCLGYQKKHLIDTGAGWTVTRPPLSRKASLEWSLKTWSLRATFAQSEKDAESIQAMVSDLQRKLAGVDYTSTDRE